MARRMAAAVLAVMLGVSAPAWAADKGWSAVPAVLMGTQSFHGVAYEGAGGLSVRLLSGPGTMYLELRANLSGTARQVAIKVDGGGARMLGDCLTVNSGRTICRSNDVGTVQAVAKAFAGGSAAELTFSANGSKGQSVKLPLAGFAAVYKQSDLSAGPGPAPKPAPAPKTAAARPAAPAKPRATASLSGRREAPPRPTPPGDLDLEGLGNQRLIDVIRPMIRPATAPTPTPTP